MSDPTLSDNDFKNQMAWVWTTLKDFEGYDFPVPFSEMVPETISGPSVCLGTF